MNSHLTYCIACCARSGSTYLAELCESTGRLGIPREYINPDPMCGPLFRRKISVPADAPHSAYVDSLLRERSSPNGVFGIKVVNYEENKELLAGFAVDRWIFLRRHDRVAQAISLYKATANKQWVWRKGEAKPSPQFDADKIRGIQHYLGRKDSEWLEFFNQRNVEPLELWYEDILDDPATTVTQVCEFVGVSTKDLPPPTVTTRIQRDAVTDQWKERLLAENADSSDNTSTTATEASDW